MMKFPFTPLQQFIRSQGFGMTVGEFGQALTDWGHPPCPIGVSCQKINESMPDASPEEQMAALMTVWEQEFDLFWVEKLPSKAEKYSKGDAYFS